MARSVNKLSALSIQKIAKAGQYGDGNGLYLIVDPSGAKRWLYIFRWEGKHKEMGLGGFPGVSLAEAREKAIDARRLVRDRTNPIEARKRERAASQSSASSAQTFGEFADTWVRSIISEFRNEKHRWQWTQTLKVYAAALSPLPINCVETEHVLDVLRPIWTTKHDTASRLRGRIERVLDAAKVMGLRTGENPARWRGHLDKLLTKRIRLNRGHHPALPYQDMPAFMVELRERRAVSALALEFTILCASRTGEVIGAQWSEIKRNGAVWIIPGSRMKAGREHRVPLGKRALAILDEVELLKKGDHIFPGQKKGKPLSNMAMLNLLERMKRPGITVHGFRSSFRDWAGDTTSFPRELAETALAHVVGDETERAYSRSDSLEKRRKLMEAWAKFLSGEATTPKQPKAKNRLPKPDRTNQGN